MPQPVTPVTGFAMTGFLQEVRCKSGGGMRAPRPTERFVGADDPVRPGPITQHLVGQGPCALPWVREKSGRAVGEIGEALPVAEEASRFRGSAPIGGHDSDRKSVGTTVGNRRPLRKRYKRCSGQATTRVAPTVGIIWGHEVFLFSCKFILEKQLGICYTLHYSGNKFLSA